MTEALDASIELHFGFLVESYGFTQIGRTYVSDRLNLEIQIVIGREPPGTLYPELIFKLASEPDCPVLPLGWILYYFEEQETRTWIDGASLEGNAQFAAKLVRKYGPRLLMDVTQWWLPAQKYRLMIWERHSQTVPVPTFHHIYEYIRRKKAGEST